MYACIVYLLTVVNVYERIVWMALMSGSRLERVRRVNGGASSVGIGWYKGTGKGPGTLSYLSLPVCVCCWRQRALDETICNGRNVLYVFPKCTVIFFFPFHLIIEIFLHLEFKSKFIFFFFTIPTIFVVITTLYLNFVIPFGIGLSQWLPLSVELLTFHPSFKPFSSFTLPSPQFLHHFGENLFLHLWAFACLSFTSILFLSIRISLSLSLSVGTPTSSLRLDVWHSRIVDLPTNHLMLQSSFYTLFYSFHFSSFFFFFNITILFVAWYTVHSPKRQHLD